MMPRSWFMLICFAFIFVNSSVAETLGQKILQKYQEQVQDLDFGAIGSVKFLKYIPDPNSKQLSVIKLRLHCWNLKNFYMPSDIRTISIDCNDKHGGIFVATGGAECTKYCYSIVTFFDHLLRDSIYRESEDSKNDIIAILESSGLSNSEALDIYKAARQNLIETNERDLWMMVFAFDKKKLAQIEDPMLATKYAIILKSNPAIKIDWMDTDGGTKTTFPQNIMVFENKVGTVQFWPTSDDTFNMFSYSFQQYDKDENLILWGRLKIKKEAAGKDRGQSFLWQLHRNTELLD